MCDHRNDRCGSQHQADREQQDRAKVGTEFAPRGQPRRRVDERWQKEKEDQLWIQFDVWQAGNETEC